MKGGDKMAKKTMSTWAWVSYILVIIGAINWGLFGSLGYDLVDSIFVAESTMATVIYTLIGLAGLWVLYDLYSM